MKKENNKGITLIALVITIIIMIILVAVSVALVVKGDLFGNAQEGTEQTRIEAEKEQLTEYVYGQYRQNEATKKVEVNLDKVKEILEGDKDKFNGDAKIEGDKLTVTGKSGKTYVIYKNGKISEPGQSEGIILYWNDENEEDSELVILGDNGDKKIKSTEWMFLLEGDYTLWDKTTENDIIKYSKEIEEKEGEHYNQVINCKPNVEVNKDLFNSLKNNGIDIFFVKEAEADYMYYFISKENYWGVLVDTITEKEAYTDSFEKEILGYPVLDFSGAFDEGSMTQIPTIPENAKSIEGIFHHTNNITEFSYEGTIDQFKQIEGYDNLFDAMVTRVMTVHCKDGDFVMNYVEGNIVN